MTLKDRPDLRTPDHDLDQTNSALLPTVYQTNGIADGSIGNPRAHNGLLHSSGKFLRYFDFAGVRNDDWLSPKAMRLTSGATGQLAYPLASGLTGLSPVPTTVPPTYMFEGSRLAFDLTLTKPDPSVIPGSVNLDPISFAANRVTWIYITAAGVVSLDVQAPTTPAAPPAGSFAVVGVTTSGTDVASLDYVGTPDYEFRIGSPGQPFFLDSTVSMLVVGPPETGLRALTVSGNGVQTAVSVDGAGGPALAAATTSASVAAAFNNFGTGGAASFGNDSATDRAVTIENTDVGGGLQITVATGPALAVSGGASTFVGNVSLGDNSGDTINIGGGATDVASLNTNLVGSASTIVQTGTVELLAGAPSPVAGQLALGVTGSLGFHDGSSGKFVHYSSAGFVYATGDQEAATGLLASHQVAQTSASATAQGGQVRVIIYGELQVNSLGSTFTLKAQEDQGGFTDILPNKVVTTTHTGADANAWQEFRHERVFAPLTTATFYRLEVTAQGGHTINLREVRLRVVKERY